MKPSRSHEECCRLLDVRAGCPPEELRRAFRRQTMLWHPDRFPQGSELFAEAEERIKAINEAYTFLQSHPRPVPIILTSDADAARLPASRRLPWVLLAVALALGSWLVGSCERDRRQGQIAAVPAPPPRQGPSAEGVPAAPPERPTTTVRTHGLVIFAPPPQEVEKLPEETARACEQFLRNALLVRDRVEQLSQQQPVPVVHSHDELIVFGAYSIERESAGNFGYVLCFPPHPPRVIEGKKSVDEVVAAVVQSMKDYEEYLRARSKEPRSADK